jgi:DNA-binding CsgD family transcriptional regulator
MLEDLTFREREIFDLLLERFSPKEIAHKLNISRHTVAFHRTNLYNKLGVQNVKEFFAKYSTNGKEAPAEPEAKPIGKTSGALSDTIPVSRLKKNKIFRLLLPVGLVIIAFSVLFSWIFIKKSSAYTTPKGIIIPVYNMGFFSTSDGDLGGNSTSEVFITREEIDGVSVDVLNIKINLVKRETDSEGYFANAHTYNFDLIQRLRQANGIRFKARGNGKLWTVDFFTKESTEEGNYPHYSYFVNTVRDQVIVVDIPYSSLFLPDYFSQYSFDFNKETITGMSITANLLHGFGPSLLQIFDFEIY